MQYFACTVKNKNLIKDVFFHNTYLFLFTTPRNSKYIVMYFLTRPVKVVFVHTQCMSVHKCFL